MFLPNDNNNSRGNRDDKSIPPPTPRTTSGRHRTQFDYGRHDDVKRSHSVVCNYCEQRGHVMAECWLLQQKKKPDALVYSVQEPLGVSGTILENKPSGTVPDHEMSDSGRKGSHKMLALIVLTFHSCQMVQCL